MIVFVNVIILVLGHVMWLMEDKCLAFACLHMWTPLFLRSTKYCRHARRDTSTSTTSLLFHHPSDTSSGTSGTIIRLIQVRGPKYRVNVGYTFVHVQSCSR